MLFKLLFFAILIYFVVKTTARLIHAMKTDQDASRLDRRSSAQGQGPPRTRSYAEEDIEDAKFVDV